MLELKLAQTFDNAFSCYQLWKPSNRQAGWPDRGIQINDSKFIWCELKTTSLRKDNTIQVSNFDQAQAAFMFKWQKAGGHCFLLVAIHTGQEDVGYAIITQLMPNYWLSLNKRILHMDNLSLFAETIDDVTYWFRTVYDNR
jgi:penicillin-binding protein-related factor A (putative recombinase)